MDRPIIYHIPVCPFSQRINILLELKGIPDAVDMQVIDITRPYPDWLLELTGGSTVLPILQDEEGRVLKESLVLLAYVEERFTDQPVARQDVYERGTERMLIALEDAYAAAGYSMVMNRDRAAAPAYRERLLAVYQRINTQLMRMNPEGTWAFDRFGLAECVFTPLMMRFWFLDYYEAFALPQTPDYERVTRWKNACLAHPAAQQVCYEEMVKLYYDYAVGFGNGALPDGRIRSSFAFDPDWPDRPMPPRDKYDRIASDAELGLLT